MSTLRERETGRDVENDGSRFWICTLDRDMPGYALFGSEDFEATVGIVDEVAGGIVAYAAEENAEAIVEALRARLGEV